MNILMVCEFFDDALDYQENMLARAYGRAGHKVTVVASTIRSLHDYVRDGDRGHGPASDEQCAWGRLVRVPFRYNIMHRIKRFQVLTPLFEEVRPQLLFFHDIIPNLDEAVRHVRSDPRCALIMDYHADISNSGANWLSRRLLHGVIRKRMLNEARPHLRRILPVTPGSADFLQEFYGVGDAEMELLPLGTDQQYAASVLLSDARARVRSSLAIPDDALVIFSGGKLAPYKRTEDVIAAVGSLAGLSVHAIIVGAADAANPGYADQLAKAAAQLDTVHLVGWQDRAGVYAHMAAADIAVFPASQSVLWQQSLGMGLPLIVSESSAALRGVQHVDYLNRHNNLIKLDPAIDLVEQIAGHALRLHEDRAVLATMSQGALRTAADILDYAAIAQRTLTFCRAGAGSFGAKAVT